VERRGLTERKPFQQENSRDTEHGKPSFRFGKVRESSETTSNYKDSHRKKTRQSALMAPSLLFRL
jgi:hypothetical protein